MNIERYRFLICNRYSFPCEMGFVLSFLLLTFFIFMINIRKSQFRSYNFFQSSHSLFLLVTDSVLLSFCLFLIFSVLFFVSSSINRECTQSRFFDAFIAFRSFNTVEKCFQKLFHRWDTLRISRKCMWYRYDGNNSGVMNKSSILKHNSKYFPLCLLALSTGWEL